MQPSPVEGSATITALLAPSANTLLVATSEGQLRARVDGEWQTEDSTLLGGRLVESMTFTGGRAVALASGLAVERNAGTGAWSVLVDMTDTCVPRAETRFSPSGMLYAVCEYYPVHIRRAAGAAEFQEGYWSLMPGLVWPFSDDDIWVTGRSYARTIHRFSGGDWTDGAAWTEVALPSGIPESGHFSAIASPAPGELVLVGTGGLVLRMHSGQWSRVEADTSEDFRAVDARDGYAVAVGNAGTVRLITGDVVTRWNAPVVDFVAVSIADDGSVHVAGGSTLGRFVNQP